MPSESFATNSKSGSTIRAETGKRGALISLSPELDEPSPFNKLNDVDTLLNGIETSCSVETTYDAEASSLSLKEIRLLQLPII